MPGVYARHNALDVPALDPHGQAIEDSVSRVLEIRHQTKDGDEFRTAIEYLLADPRYAEAARTLGGKVAREVMESPVATELERLAACGADRRKAA